MKRRRSCAAMSLEWTELYAEQNLQFTAIVLFRSRRKANVSVGGPFARYMFDSQRGTASAFDRSNFAYIASDRTEVGRAVPPFCAIRHLLRASKRVHLAHGDGFGTPDHG